MNNITQSDKRSTDKGKSAKPALVKALMQDDNFDAQQWRRYIEQEIGFILPDVQLQWLINAIDHTATSHRLTAKQLWSKVPKDDALRQQLLDKVLIHESRFFRHIPSIDFVTQCALEHQRLRIMNDNSQRVDQTFRIWSVGCSSGQEVWSLAMSLASEQLVDYQILGTDISQQALAMAESGQYDKRQQPLIPQHCQQFVHPLTAKTQPQKLAMADLPTVDTSMTGSQTHWQVAPALQQYVRFVLHNIIEQKSPNLHLQQVIICQNMLLYFRKFDQRDILARLSEQCALGGYIVLAPGEALFWRPSNMRRVAHPQVNVWQKISA